MKAGAKFLLGAAGFTAAGLLLSRLRRKPKCTLELLLVMNDRDRPEDDNILGKPDPWRPLDVDPVVLGADGPSAMNLPMRYWSNKTRLYGVTPEMMTARVRCRATQKLGFRCWIEMKPKQAGTTTFAIGDETGPKEHVAIEFASAKVVPCA